jgi:hypothetical protein
VHPIISVHHQGLSYQVCINSTVQLRKLMHRQVPWNMPKGTQLVSGSELGFG